MSDMPAANVHYLYFYVLHARNEAPMRRCIALPHKHNCGEIMLVTEGESIISCNGIVTHIHAPYIAYYPAGVTHEQNNTSSRIYDRWCFPIFLPDVDNAAGLLNDFFVVQLSKSQCEQFSAYVNILYSHYGVANDTHPDKKIQLSPHDATRLKYLLYLFLHELKPLIPEAVSRKSGYINDVCLYIKEHLNERLTLGSLADRLFIGRTTLTRDFRRSMEMSVVEFITAMRIGRAKLLLQERQSLSEIAEKCGFSSVPYFIKVFTDHTGLSPTQYRNALEKKPPEQFT